MCGIFGIIPSRTIKKDCLNTLVTQSIQRGSDSSGLYYIREENHFINRGSYRLEKLLYKVNLSFLTLFLTLSQ